MFLILFEIRVDLFVWITTCLAFNWFETSFKFYFGRERREAKMKTWDVTKVIIIESWRRLLEVVWCACALAQSPACWWPTDVQQAAAAAGAPSSVSPSTRYNWTEIATLGAVSPYSSCTTINLWRVHQRHGGR